VRGVPELTAGALSLQLKVVPINGRIVLRTPLDDETKEVQPGA
jgi:hypothetical protein